MATEQEITGKIQEWVRNCGENFATKLIATYVRDASKRLADIHQAHASGDRALLTRSAHTMKSSCGQVGAMAVSESAKTIELASRAAKFEEAGAVLPALDAEFAVAKKVLEAIGASPSA